MKDNMILSSVYFGVTSLKSQELSDLDVFFEAFEKTHKELQQKGVPVVVTGAAKDELGWHVIVRLRPSSVY